jgi:hypothetical protein
MGQMTLCAQQRPATWMSSTFSLERSLPMSQARRIVQSMHFDPRPPARRSMVDSHFRAMVIPFCQVSHSVRLCYSTLHNHGEPVRYAFPPKKPGPHGGGCVSLRKEIEA